MEVLYSFEDAKKEYDPCVMALGTFDGLHLGHVDVINSAKAYAKEKGLKLAVFTFSNHPYAFIKPESIPVALLDAKDKIKKFEELGVDLLIDIPFDSQLANLSSDDFLKKLEVFNYKCLVVGENFTYGYGGLGRTDALKNYGENHGIDIVVRKLIQINGNIVSSTSIRNYLTHGEFEKANSMLGREYTIHGKVEKGFQRGRLIGFPTLNINVDRSKIALPPSGGYVVKIKIKGKYYFGMSNLGKNPTFDDVKNELLEIHVFNFNEDVYGEDVEINFIKFIRGETKFNSVDELKNQIEADKKEILASLRLEN